MTKKSDTYTIKDVAIDTILGKVEYSTPEIQKKRLDICNGCPKLNKTINQCNECGCFVKQKVKYKKSSCPLGKW